MERKDKQIITYLFIMVVVLASLPLFSSSVFAPGLQHDTFFHTQRIWSVKNALAEGQMPVRIYSEIYNGYGYGAPLYYPDIFLYIPAILCLLGVPLAVSYNIFLILVNIATLGIAYYSYSRIAKSQIIGTVAAILYTLSTYRLLDLYTRGAIGELLALVFCPLVLCGFTLLKRGEYNKWWILAIAYTGLLQSHMLTLVMLVGAGVLFVLLHWKSFLNGKSILSIVKAGVLFFLLNLWFLLPFLAEMQEHSIWGKPNFWDSGAALVQLFDVLMLSATGIEAFNGEIAEAIPKTPGVLLLIGALLLMFSLVLYKDEIKEEKKRVLGYLLWGTLAVIMVTNIFPWKIIQNIPKVRAIFPKFQFIWRFNVLAILLLSLAAAYGFYYFFIQNAADRLKNLVIIGMVAGLFGLVFINQFVKQAGQYENEEVVQNGYMDMLYLAPGFEYLRDGEIESNAGVTCSETLYDSGSFSCQLSYEGNEVPESAIYVDVPLAYYTGYNAYIDGERVDTGCGAKGVVRVYLPNDFKEGRLEVFYEDGADEKIANIISLLSGLGLVLMVVSRRRKKF